jgi:hypothetical protein
MLPNKKQRSPRATANSTGRYRPGRQPTTPNVRAMRGARGHETPHPDYRPDRTCVDTPLMAGSLKVVLEGSSVLNR